MIDRFLNSKHWQLFILMYALPMLFQIVMMSMMFSNIMSDSNPDPFAVFGMMKYFPIMMVLYMALFFGWLWSIGIGLQKYVPNHVKMKTTRFKIFFFIPLVYMMFFLFFIGSMFTGIAESPDNFNPGSMGSVIGVIVPLHLLSMFGIFHCLHFTAKTIKTVESQEEVRFSEFAGEFFMLWFYFVGIWILQPRINKIVKNENLDANQSGLV